MHLNPLSGEGSEGADRAPVFLSIPSLLVSRREGLILERRVSESLRGVAPTWTLGTSPFIPLNPWFSPLDPLLSVLSHQVGECNATFCWSQCQLPAKGVIRPVSPWAIPGAWERSVGFLRASEGRWETLAPRRGSVPVSCRPLSGCSRAGQSRFSCLGEKGCGVEAGPAGDVTARGPPCLPGFLG